MSPAKNEIYIGKNFNNWELLTISNYHYWHAVGEIEEVHSLKLKFNKIKVMKNI